jgi:superfamily II DNA or RNA helicase
MSPLDLTLLTPGAPVKVRGRDWTVAARAEFADCASVSLVAPAFGVRRTLLAPFDRFVAAERPRHLHVVKPSRLLHGLRRLAARSHPAGGLPVAAVTTIDLHPYQLEPALAAAAGAARILLADAVGLGKTVQAGLIVTCLHHPAEAGSHGGRSGGHPPARVLIATPAGLREQWQHELQRHFGLAAVLADTAWLSARARELPPDVNPWALPALYIASFDLLKRPEVLRPLEEVAWDAMIVDEAHNAAPGTARRAALDALARRARQVVLLTATPHAGDDEAHGALLALGACGADAEPPVVFRRTRASLGIALPRRTLLLPVRLTALERRMHRQLAAYTGQVAIDARRRGDPRARLAAIVLRKRALSSATALALSAARRLELLAGADHGPALQLALPLGDEDPLEDHVPDSLLAAPGLANAGRERSLLSAIVDNARRAARDESKLRRLVRFLSRIAEPAIVFTEYRDTLTRLASALRAAGHDPLVLHGGQAPAERAAVQRGFNTGGRLLLATDAASEGLNLHARCRLVVHYELPWTPSRLEQRTGRVDRLGQPHRVHEILLVARDTAERMVLARLVARAARARRALHDASPLLDRLTESQVAAAVLEGQPLPPPPRTATGGAGLLADAEAEAARLLLLRGYLARSGDRDDPAAPDLWVCAPRRGRPAHHVDAVCSLEIVGEHGEVLHGEMVVARHQLAAPVSVSRTRDVKDWAQRWIRDAEAMVIRETCLLLRARVDRIATRIRRGSVRAGEREAAIACALPSASQGLVQAGLFDRRAVRARDAVREAAPGPGGNVAPSRADAPPLRLTPRLRLTALVLR